MSRNWNYEIRGTPRIKSESSYNRCPHAGNRFQLSSEFFFARGLFILTFLYPSVLESSQNDMSGPDIGGFMVSEHGVFSLRKIAKSKNLSVESDVEVSKNTTPKQLDATTTPEEALLHATG